ncbi:hypothetical protein [Parasitella parasitica]|uniref:C2H2-type domain-containing protein n=1 Tax=Parasitella parasitica TaxID=35722 RepID=A0A0B7NMD2_9FUNG|nr:hypothetical protein [Parasitella parasitica]
MQTSSPSMATPYLDSSNMDTPYLDNFSAETPPFFDTASDVSPYLMYASFAINQHPQNINPNDVFIAGYLDGYENSDIAKLAHDPLKFNGDPSVLLIDKSKSLHLSYPADAAAESKPSPTVKLETVTEEGPDSLFPPLNSSQQSMKSENRATQDVSLDQLLGFDPSSPLSEEDGQDYTDQETRQVKQETQEDDKHAQQQHSSSRKRKAPDTAATASGRSSSAKKTKTSTSSFKKGTAPKTAKEPKEPKLHKCPLCSHVSKRRYNLWTHVKTHNKDRIKEFDCLHPGCPKSFDRRHDRDRHLATVHRGERSFNCPDCKSVFSRRDALSRHLIQKHDYDENDLAE